MALIQLEFNLQLTG